VPNDVTLNADVQIALITGPNMAGKSTYIRQVALLTLLAHTGIIYSRGGSAHRSDRPHLHSKSVPAMIWRAGSQHSWWRLCETANILNSATPRSLVILDEIGRGTSTFDGLSLAWSIVEYLHNQVGAKTLFANALS